VKISNNVAKIWLIMLKLLSNTFKRLKNYFYFEKNKLIKVCENERLVVGALANREVIISLNKYI